MVSKCANPTCSATFQYRRGKIFRFPKEPVEKGRPANTHSVQHFWLCEACFTTYSLEYDQEKGVALRRHWGEAPEPAPCTFIAVA
jgi:hypothetical protein